MAEQLGTISISFVGNYKSRDEIESNAPREYGSMARTEDADYCYDGKEWTIIRLSQYVTFRVVSRHHITGRGYVTVIHNPDLLPISSAWSASAIRNCLTAGCMVSYSSRESSPAA